jgi:hypothetical protein
MKDPATSSSTATLVTALFWEPDAAERAYRYAIELGYESAEINVLLSEETRERYFSQANHPASDFATKASESTEEASNVADELGGPRGGTAGTLAPALAAVGTLLLIPGLGILAAGPVAIALTAAGAVGVTGGLIAALTNWGIPKDRVHSYDEGIRAGGILLAVKARSKEDAKTLEQRWKSIGGDRVQR